MNEIADVPEGSSLYGDRISHGDILELGSEIIAAEMEERQGYFECVIAHSGKPAEFIVRISQFSRDEPLVELPQGTIPLGIVSTSHHDRLFSLMPKSLFGQGNATETETYLPLHPRFQGEMEIPDDATILKF